MQIWRGIQAGTWTEVYEWSMILMMMMMLALDLSVTSQFHISLSLFFCIFDLFTCDDTCNFSIGIFVVTFCS